MTFEQLYRTSLWKTLWVNFSLLPVKQAWRLPFFVAHSVEIQSLKGSAEVALNRPNVVQIGYHRVGVISRHVPTVLEIKGKWIVDGRAFLGHGSGISVIEGGCLHFGDGFQITSSSRIVCKKFIRIGKNVLCSWDATIMDTDLHRVLDADGNDLNPDAQIVIGNNVWIGFGAFVGKGSAIPDGCVIGARSLVNKKIQENNAIYVGNPARCIQTKIQWEA